MEIGRGQIRWKGYSIIIPCSLFYRYTHTIKVNKNFQIFHSRMITRVFVYLFNSKANSYVKSKCKYPIRYVNIYSDNIVYDQIAKYNYFTRVNISFS